MFFWWFVGEGGVYSFIVWFPVKPKIFLWYLYEMLVQTQTLSLHCLRATSRNHQHSLYFSLRPPYPTGSFISMQIIFMVEGWLFSVMMSTESNPVPPLGSLHFLPLAFRLHTFPFHPVFVTNVYEEIKYFHFPLCIMVSNLWCEWEEKPLGGLKATGHGSIVNGFIMEGPAGRLQGKWGCLSLWWSWSLLKQEAKTHFTAEEGDGRLSMLSFHAPFSLSPPPLLAWHK